MELASQYEECWPDKACKTQVNFRRAETPRLALAGTGTETTATISNADTDRSSRERPGPISFVMNLDFKGHRGKRLNHITDLAFCSCRRNDAWPGGRCAWRAGQCRAGKKIEQAGLSTLPSGLTVQPTLPHNWLISEMFLAAGNLTHWSGGNMASRDPSIEQLKTEEQTLGEC